MARIASLLPERVTLSRVARPAGDRTSRCLAGSFWCCGAESCCVGGGFGAVRAGWLLSTF